MIMNKFKHNTIISVFSLLLFLSVSFLLSAQEQQSPPFDGRGILNSEAVELKPLLATCHGLESTHKDSKDKSFDICRALKHKNIIPVAIIGAGPAGLCAALYTARAKLTTYVYTGGNIGGYLNEIKQIENWPALPRTTGATIAENLQEQMETFGVRFIHDNVTSIDLSQWPYVIETEDTRAHALAVIMATGFSPKKPNIPGVDQYWGLGVSSCTLCDAPFHKDQDVIVAGGDDYAAERALQLAEYAKKVVMVIKEPHATATAIVLDYLKARPNISMIFNAEITHVLGDEHRVTDVEVFDHHAHTKSIIPAQGVYVASDYIPNSDLVKGQVKMTPEGYIALLPGTQQTSVKGVFAAGTVADDKYRKAVMTCGDGGKAGMEVIEFLHNTVYFHEPEHHDVQHSLLTVDRAAKHEITSITSQKELRDELKKNKVVVVYFYRLFCPYCQEVISHITALKREFGDEIQIVKANAHNAEQLARDIAIDGVPSVVIYNNGVIYKRLRGIEIKRKLASKLKKLIN